MNEIEKFRADVRRAIKHERNENSGSYDGLRASKKITEFFCRSAGSLQSLASSIAEYWLEDKVGSTGDYKTEPTQENVDWLAAALSFLQKDLDECGCLTGSDWQKLGELVNYEAEDLPIEELSALMSMLLEKKAF